MTTVYTDGACLGNPGPGGWAWAVPGGRYASGAEPLSTNQRMEVTAVLEAARSIEGAVHVMSDSAYVVNCFRERWWEGWIARDWKTSAKKDVANRDLWEPLIDLYRARRAEITFAWVKGHADDPINDLVDRLAVEAATAQQGRSGSGVPELLGPPDSKRDRRLPSGRLTLVTGDKPPALGGYGENPVASRARERIAEVLSAKRSMHPDLSVVTGLNLGAEQLGAEAARDAGVPFVAVVPYPEQDAVWPPSTQRRYRDLLDAASVIVQLESKRPETPQKAGAALRRRDAWLVRNVDEAVVLWTGADSAVGKLVRSLEDKLGEEVWLLDPSG